MKPGESWEDTLSEGDILCKVKARIFLYHEMSYQRKGRQPQSLGSNLPVQTSGHLPSKRYCRFGKGQSKRSAECSILGFFLV